MKSLKKTLLNGGFTTKQLGETEAFKKYLTSCEKEFKSNLIGSFTIPSDQAVKDLLDL